MIGKKIEGNMDVFRYPSLLDIFWPRGSFNDNFRIKRKIEEIWKWFYICKNLINPVPANVPPRSTGQRKNGNCEFIYCRVQKFANRTLAIPNF